MSDEQGKKSNKLAVPVVLGVITIVFAAAAFAWAGPGSSSSKVSEPPSSGDASASPAAPTSAGSVSAQSAPPTPQVLLDVSGSGTKQTQKFTTSGDWTLDWSYDCSSDYSGQGNFQVFVYNDDGSLDSSDGLVNQFGAKGSDTQYYYDAGTHYLSVNSECSWHVTAKG